MRSQLILSLCLAHAFESFENHLFDFDFWALYACHDGSLSTCMGCNIMEHIY